jgi:transcriptional regulator with XRE-family HTH domain
MNRTSFKLLMAIRERGLTQVDLVCLADISSEARLSRIIRNRCKPTNFEIVRLSDALEVPPEELGLTLSSDQIESSDAKK